VRLVLAFCLVVFVRCAFAVVPTNCVIVHYSLVAGQGCVVMADWETESGGGTVCAAGTFNSSSQDIRTAAGDALMNLGAESSAWVGVNDGGIAGTVELTVTAGREYMLTVSEYNPGGMAVQFVELNSPDGLSGERYSFLKWGFLTFTTFWLGGLMLRIARAVSPGVRGGQVDI